MCAFLGSPKSLLNTASLLSLSIGFIYNIIKLLSSFVNKIFKVKLQLCYKFKFFIDSVNNIIYTFFIEFQQEI